MSQVPAWFERKFDYSFPAELYPNICARLRGTPVRLEELMGAISCEALVKKREGKWSAQEQAGHLADLEPLWLARVGDYESGNAELTVADLRNQKTDDAKHNERSLEDILKEFRVERKKLLDRLDGCDDSMFCRSIPHPRLKTPMRLMDHLFFVAEHDDHHLARIWEMLRPTG